MTRKKVSIGMPIYNGDKTLEPVLKSILSQTYTNFELIISDNASTDKTQSICAKYELIDSRIKYIRQKKNIGFYSNFKFVLDKSSGDYFMWIADDDIRSNDFLKEVVSLLDGDCKCVAATTPDHMEEEVDIRDFSITGNQYNRFKLFIENCWASHGLFYSLTRVDLIKEFNFEEFETLGGDWIYNTFLLSKGNICRTKKGMTTFSKGGISNSNQRFSKFRKKNLHWFIPLYDFSVFFIKLSSSFSYIDKINIIISIVKLNFYVFIMQLRHEISAYIRR
jgi:glycosyltransferase involved in cell wall biosynthesis